MNCNLDDFDHNLTAWHHWNDGECIGKSSPNGRKFQIHEILQFPHIFFVEYLEIRLKRINILKSFEILGA
jgi:hypothetical protein